MVDSEARAEDTGGGRGGRSRSGMGERAAPEEWAEDQPSRLDPGGGGLGPQPGGGGGRHLEQPYQNSRDRGLSNRIWVIVFFLLYCY